jgi:hypothetical protein
MALFEEIFACLLLNFFANLLAIFSHPYHLKLSRSRILRPAPSLSALQETRLVSAHPLFGAHGLDQLAFFNDTFNTLLS